MMARNLMESLALLASGLAAAGREVCGRDRGQPGSGARGYAELTLSAATALNPYIGYDKAHGGSREGRGREREVAARGRP